MIDVETILRAWPIILAILMGIIWNVRQGARIDALEKSDLSHKAEKVTLWSKMDTIQATVTAVLTGLAKIEGKLEAKDGK